MHRGSIALVGFVVAAAAFAGCSRSMMTDRTSTLLDVSASIGSARHAAYWFQQDLTPETYKGATDAELGSLRARAQILAAEADKLDAYSSKCDPFEPTKNEPSLRELVAWQRELDEQRIDLTREMQILQVRLGMRTPEDAAMREDLSAIYR